MVLFPRASPAVCVDRQQGRDRASTPDGRFLINIELDSVAAPITLLMSWKPEGKTVPRDESPDHSPFAEELVHPSMDYSVAFIASPRIPSK